MSPCRRQSLSADYPRSGQKGATESGRSTALNCGSGEPGRKADVPPAEGRIMDVKDIVSLVISVLSGTAAIAAVIISRATIAKQREMQKWIVHHDLLNRADGMLMDDPSLLRVMGIEPSEVMKNGLTPQELIFINAHLNASLAMTRVTGEKNVILLEQRKSFLCNEKVRVAWKKYLRNRTFSESPWSKAVDAYIAEIESAGETSHAKPPARLRRVSGA